MSPFYQSLPFSYRILDIICVHKTYLTKYLSRLSGNDKGRKENFTRLDKMTENLVLL